MDIKNLIKSWEDLRNILEGLEGENRIRNYFMSEVENCRFTQLDMLAQIDNQWYSIEIKHQEPYEPPPFAGHGLPPWQVKMRMNLYKDKGIVPLFFVVDKSTSEIYYNSLIALEEGRKTESKTGSRIIYHIDSFKKLSDITPIKRININ